MLRLIYDDLNETFKKLLQRDRPRTIHENIIQQSVIEMLKVKRVLVSKMFESMVVINDNPTQLR